MYRRAASVKEGTPTSTTACLTLMRVVEVKAEPYLAHVVTRHEESPSECIRRKMVVSKATFQETEDSVFQAPVRSDSAFEASKW